MIARIVNKEKQRVIDSIGKMGIGVHPS